MSDNGGFLIQPLESISIDRMFRAIELVLLRRHRITQALHQAEICYAVIGAHAVAYWVETEDAGAGRNTPNTDVLIRREDEHRTVTVLDKLGFACQSASNHVSMKDRASTSRMIDGHILFAEEHFREHDLEATPKITEAVDGGGYRVLMLGPLVRMKLVAFRTIDRVHLRDLAKVNLIDKSWLANLPNELAHRLELILDDPLG